MAGVTDTSVLYAVLDEADPNHVRALGLLDQHLGLEVPPAVVAELELTVRKKAGLSVARDVIPRFLDANPHLVVMDADLHPEAIRIWNNNGRLSYTDCHAIAGALLRGGELVTLDKHQEGVWRRERARTR